MLMIDVIVFVFLTSHYKVYLIVTSDVGVAIQAWMMSMIDVRGRQKWVPIK